MTVSRIYFLQLLYATNVKKGLFLTLKGLPKKLVFSRKDKQNLNANIHPLHHNFSKVQTNREIIVLKELL